MSAFVAVALKRPDDERDDAIEYLLGLVRPEFAVPTYRPDPADLVLRRSTVRGGQLWSPGRSQGLCAAHHTRWVSRARPDLSAFVAAAAPVRAGSRG